MHYIKTSLLLTVVFSICAFAVLGMVTTALADSTNLIANPSLETASGSTPANWSKDYWGSVAPTFTYPVTGHTGSGARVTFSKNSDGDAKWLHDPATVTAGKTYNFSGWYNSTTATEVDLMFTGSNGTTWNWFADVPSSNGAWKEVTGTFTAPSGATAVVVTHLLWNTGSLTIDDYSLTEKGTDTTPPPPPPNGNGMVSITFDDSWSSQYNKALPIINTAGMKVTFYITTEPVKNGWSDFMKPWQVKELAKQGHEVADHTVTHADLTTLSSADIDKEIKNSKKYIEGLIGKPVTTIAYPYGAENKLVEARVAAAGYIGGRNSIDAGMNGKTINPYNLSSYATERNSSIANIKKSIDAAKANGTWYILTFHEIKANGDQYSNTPAQLQQIVDYIKASGIKVVTVEEGLHAYGY